MSKSKFFTHNKSLFLQYFEDSEQFTAGEKYDAMIKAGRFETMEQIIRSKSKFNADDWLNIVVADHFVDANKKG